jgi:phosphoribosylformylglycinamidine synthase
VVQKAIIKKSIISAYSLKHFGVAEGLTKMAIGNDIGVEFNNVNTDELFGINYGGLIVEIPQEYNPNIILKDSNYKIIGKTNDSQKIINKQLNITLSINEAKELMISKLANVFVNTTKNDDTNINLKHYLATERKYSKRIVSVPLVVIPVFPGTNCEYDSQYAFERAGAKVQQVLIRNMTSKDLLQSIDELVKAIQKANIVMIPGGFSAADEPDGSAKFIVNVFNNLKVKKAITELLEKRDGLMLGICNGFQALIKLGLLPYGKIQKPKDDSPTLTFNKISHHMSGIVRTKIVSNNSP